MSSTEKFVVNSKEELRLKIEIWSDYACPFCYIGEVRLKKALQKIPVRVEVEFKSFELDPTAPREVVSATDERFAEKYGLTIEQARAQIESISEMGRAEGLDFRYLTTRYTNTFDALRLTKFAQSHGHDEIIDKLFDAYFTKNLELADFDVLKKISAECGLDAAEVEKFLNSDEFAAEVRSDERKAAAYGIHAVPYFVIDGKYAVNGAQPTEFIAETLKKILAENSAENFSAGSVCDENGCK